MKTSTTNLPAILQYIGAIVLFVGFVSAVAVYRTAGNNPAGVLGYEQIDGSLYPIMPEDSKQYLRSLELYGGKASVLAEEFRLWFAGLWRGRRLAYTLGCITTLVSLVIFLVAGYLRYDEEFETPDGNHGAGDG